MAEKKFSELTAKGATIADTDIVAISESAGGGTYTSKSVTGANIKALVTDANMTTTDITTNDVSTSKHGFAPKAPNDTTKFLRGDATWAVVPAGGLTKFTEAEATTSPNNTVYVDSLTAAGSTTNADIAIVPKGTGAFMLDIPDNTATGGNKRGARAIDLSSNRVSASQVASGADSILIGSNNTSSGTNSIAIGNGVTASNTDACAIAGGVATNTYSVAIGISSTASGSQALALAGRPGGGAVASGDNSVAIGASATASGFRAYAFGTNSISNAAHSYTFGKGITANSVDGRNVIGYTATDIGVFGDTQKSTFFLGLRTTGNTATTLTVGGGAASTNNQVILSNNSAYRFKGTIIGKQSGSTNVCAWDVDGLIVRGANAAATTLNVSNVTLVQNTPAWGTPTLAADTTNGGLQVQVTGAAATNIQWTAVIETTEVIYA